MIINPDNTTVGDICTAALRESNAVGVGQTPLAEDMNDAWARLQWMLQQWERKRWLVYHIVNFGLVSTGQQSYTIGPGGDVDTGVGSQFNNQFNNQFGNTPGQLNWATSARPAKIESAFLRQIGVFQTGGANGLPTGSSQVDYPLTILQSREDYDRITLKGLSSFPSYLWYDPAWPLGVLYPYPIPQANIYELHVSALEQLPPAFPSLTTVLALPYEYFNAIVLNLALRLRIKYGIPTFPGDPLPGQAKDALNVIRGANTAIAQLKTPGELIRPQIYNIFSDRTY